MAFTAERIGFRRFLTEVAICGEEGAGGWRCFEGRDLGVEGWGEFLREDGGTDLRGMEREDRGLE